MKGFVRFIATLLPVSYTHLDVYKRQDYMHNNPVKAGLVTELGDYLFSSAKFYENWEVKIPSELLHYRDVC